jgi:hypothetical protein
MSNSDSVRQKVQRILTKNLGNVRIDEDGDFIVSYESANVFVEVLDFGKESVIIQLTCPMVKDVKLTNELYKWVATEGQSKRIGGCRVTETKNKAGYGVIFNEQSLLADDLDESELMGNLVVLITTSAELDTELQRMFGGELFGED